MSSPSRQSPFGVAEARRTDHRILADDLYREIILDHYARPRHTGLLPSPTHRNEGVNPTCGDAIVLELEVEGERVKRVGYSAQGCSISVASASMMAERIQGLSLEEVRELTRAFKARMLAKGDPPGEVLEVDLGELEALDGVRNYPLRIKCALLAWNTLLGILEEK